MATRDSIGAPIVNIVVYTDSKSPPKLQFKYSNIVVTYSEQKKIKMYHRHNINNYYTSRNKK
jgi:hypothetical protein